ncbi:UDP-glucose 4-epimerase [Nocardiopsis flavescens]|uniref:UDP-glucose 4-epimerase n=1 Tax=Nocardiopsis flavescens TaxID=758803 RepID=A0A1M6NXU7_9ACTN|nr:UDP-glucose 4-epimerase GalE [Nocardiopsis flavescens]SHK00557.1 UDP-glucose 4-epimerase [Nocardiopsis flavescens]
MKLLVTGGAGYVGSVVTALLLEAGHDVTVLDDLSTGHRDAVPAGARTVVADVHNAADVLTPDTAAVLHFAAKSLVGESTTAPAEYWRTNVAGTLALLEAMDRHGVDRLVFSSTAAVYGEPASAAPLREDDPPVPTNPYGAGKLAVDRMLESWAHAYGLGAVSLRYFNVAGAHRGLGERHDPETHLLPNLLRAALEGTPARVHGTDHPTPDGTAVRDYLHVADLARAHLLALEAAVPGTHRVFNLGTGGGHSVREVVDTVRAVTGRPVAVHDGPRRPGDPSVLVASNERARTGLGWEPARGLAETVADAWEFTRARAAARETA